MIHLYDRASIEGALTLDLAPELRALLAERVAGLDTEHGDLTDWTEFLVVEPGDTEADVVRAVGFSPLVDPIDGLRFGHPDFQPGLDLLADRGGWFEAIYTFGSTFAYVLLVSDADGVDPALRRLCRTYATRC